jgi:hypothetical protein
MKVIKKDFITRKNEQKRVYLFTIDEPGQGGPWLGFAERAMKTGNLARRQQIAPAVSPNAATVISCQDHSATVDICPVHQSNQLIKPLTSSAI